MLHPQGGLKGYIVVNVLDYIAIRLSCPACGNAYNVPLSDILLSHEVVRAGCPVCHETECPPVFQIRLFDRAAIAELERAWNKVAEKAKRDGGQLVLLGESRDRADKGLFQEALYLEKGLVEAKGVEPLSENVTGEETTYLVQFLRGR